MAPKGQQVELTKTLINALEPRPSKYRVWDKGRDGLHLQVFPSGTRTFYCFTRSGSRWQCVRVGPWPEMSIGEARKQARKVREASDSGRDPQEERRVSRVKKKTLGELWTEYDKDIDKRLKPLTLSRYRATWKNYVKGPLGNRPLTSIRRADIIALHRRYEDTPAAANGIYRFLRGMFNQAIQWGYLEHNPASNVRMHKEGRHERFLNAEEIARLLAAIDEQERLGGGKHTRVKKRTGKAQGRGGKGMKEGEAQGISPWAAGMFRLLLFTGCRRDEIRTAKWSMVRWEGRVLALADAKTGPRNVPLPQPAIDELRRLEKIRTSNEWIIEGKKPGVPMVGANRAWKRVREAAGLPDVRLHDLRHSWASQAVSLGISLPLVGKGLGHASHKSTERYAHVDFDPVLAVADRVGAAIIDATKRPAAPVVDIAKKKEG